MTFDIRRNRNKLMMRGRYDGTALRRVLGSMHNAIVKLDYSDIVLDFGECEFVFESGMLPLLPVIRNYRLLRNTDFSLIVPHGQKMGRLFGNSGWDHWIDPIHFDHNAKDVGGNIAVRQFRTPTEQHEVVDLLIAQISKNTLFSQDQMQAVEWSLNEITDNVINHAESGVGGFVQSTVYNDTKAVEFLVADGGVGIPKTLGIKDHKIALERAIEEGVTRNKKTNQGNGLYGVYRIALVANGQFNIQSSLGNMFVHEGSVRFRDETTPYSGTFVRWSISLGASDIIRQALQINGKSHEIVHDYYEKLLDEGEGRIRFEIKKEFSSVGSRQAGREAYTKVKNFLNWGSAARVEFDFAGINIVSSSFADEVFGRLFVELGPIVFMSRISWVNARSEILGIIDRSMSKRFAQDGGQRGARGDSLEN